MASALFIEKRSAAKARRAAKSAALPQALAAIGRTRVMQFSLQFVGGRVQDGGALGLRGRRDQPAGDRVANVEMSGGRLRDVLGSHLGDCRGPAVDLLDRQAEQHALRIASSERA